MEDSVGLWSYIGYTNVAIMLVTVLLAWVTRAYTLFWKQYKKCAHIPGPPFSFPLGVGMFFARHGALHGWGKILEEGDKEQGIVRAQTPAHDIVVVSHHDHLREILRVAPHHLPKSAAKFGETARNFYSWLVGDGSVLFTDAQDHKEWVDLRRIVGRAFTTPAVVPLIHPMADVLDRLISVVKSKSAKSAGGPIPVEEMINATTLDVLGACSFSQNFGALDNVGEGKPAHPIVTSYHALYTQTGWRDDGTVLHPFYQPRFMWMPTRANRLAKANRKILWDCVDKLVAERKKQLKDGVEKKKRFADFLDILLNATDEDRLTDSQMRSNLILTITAGFETSAMNLQFALYLIAKHPEVQKRLHQEVDEVWPATERPVEDTAKRLVFTKAAVNEALRLYPSPFFTIRTVTKEVHVGGYRIPKDTIVGIPIYESMRSPYNWSDPDAFKPERFLTQEEPTKSFYSFLPFMHGARNCIGQRFAELATTMIVAALMRRFEVSLPDDYVFEYEPYTLQNAAPKHDLELIFRERNKTMS